VPSNGTTITTSFSALGRLPLIQLKGEANYEWLSHVPSVTATVENNGVQKALPATFQRGASSYEILIYTFLLNSESKEGVILLAFDSFFVPKELGINEDTHALVVRAPTTVRLLQSQYSNPSG
jgi:hypothetical protein